MMPCGFFNIPTNKTLTLQKRQGVLYSRQAEKRRRRNCTAYDGQERKEYHEKRRLSQEHGDCE